MSRQIDPDTIDMSRLPQQFRRLVELIGWPDTMALMERHAGTQIRVPNKPERHRALRGLISDRSIELLAERWPNTHIELPKMDKIIKQLRNRAIYDARKREAMSANEAARKFRLTRRWVITITNREARRDE